MTVVTAAEMRALDRWTIEHGTPGAVLMERAGGGAARVLRTRLRAARGPVVVLCGRGNNGGDGFVIARHLRRARVPVEVWLAAHPADVRGDAADMLAAWRRGRNPVHDLTGAGRVAALGDRLAKAAVTVDALLGTGLNAPVTGLVACVIESVNRWSASSGRPVLAVDIASGLSADSGHPLGAAIRATVTATFGCAKIGQVVHPGVEHTGVLDVVDIGIPPAAMAAVAPATTLLEARDVAGLLPPRPRDAHKGTFGHVLVIGGSRGKTGAALLAAEGAARAGAGLTTLAVPAVLQPVLEGRVRELMTAALGDLDTLLAGRAAVVCGPGLGVTPDTRALVANVVRHATVPVVLDADALNIVAGTTLLSERAGPTVLTPHPGEMSRLLGCDTVAVQSDRLAAARRFAAAERQPRHGERRHGRRARGRRRCAARPGPRAVRRRRAGRVRARRGRRPGGCATGGGRAHRPRRARGAAADVQGAAGGCTCARMSASPTRRRRPKRSARRSAVPRAVAS